MDSLVIQDAFEPYYAKRRPFLVSQRAARLAELRAARLKARRGFGGTSEPDAARPAPRPVEGGDRR